MSHKRLREGRGPRASLLGSPVDRGFLRVRLVVSDDREGIKAAAAGGLPGAHHPNAIRIRAVAQNPSSSVANRPKGTSRHLRAGTSSEKEDGRRRLPSRPFSMSPCAVGDASYMSVDTKGITTVARRDTYRLDSCKSNPVAYQTGSIVLRGQQKSVMLANCWRHGLAVRFAQRVEPSMHR
jgi:hypothetical protein